MVYVLVFVGFLVFWLVDIVKVNLDYLVFEIFYRLFYFFLILKIIWLLK